ncbi:hypothetical protein D8674_032654 [Pyrus ussuriensis x Pyrus communis]|uniref:Uncharacterized protein n=1 Tax=Pyrus ussuriensis x Pyrus communis TaxID=2448454 RepID=A0A5N5HIP1_9ROSA|nr:hypothetical protein D8674_032654 [Pyrus ussuriensis x Pyrus communis]
MEELEANSTQTALVLQSERDKENLYENRNQGSQVDGLINDAADEEPNLKGRIQEAEKLAAKISQEKLELIEDIAQRKCDRSCALSRLKNLNDIEMGLASSLSSEREKINILQLFLLRYAKKAHQGKPMKPVLPREEIAKNKMNFRMGHGTNSLAEENKLLKEMNARQEEGAGLFPSLGRDFYTPRYVDVWWLPFNECMYVMNQGSIIQHRLRQIEEIKWQSARPGILFQSQWDEPVGHASDNANAAANAVANPKGRIWDSLRSKKALQEQIKVSREKVDELTKSQLAFRRGPIFKEVERELKVIERDIERLKGKLPLMEQRKYEAQQCILTLRKQQSDEPSRKANTMEKLEDNSTQIPPVLESEGDDIRLQESLYENRNQCPEGMLKWSICNLHERMRLCIFLCNEMCDVILLKLLQQYDRYCACSLLDYYRNRHKAGIRDCLNLEREKMNILQLFLLRCANKSHPGLSAEGIAKHKLSFRMVHGTNNLAEEKQLLKEINVSQKEVSAGSLSSLENDYRMLPENTWWSDHQLRYALNQRKIVHYRLRQIQELKCQIASRTAILLQRKWDGAISNAKANANVAAAAIFEGKFWDALSSKKSLREQIRLTKLLFAPVRPEIKWVEKELKVIEEDIECLLKKLPLMDQREREAYGLHKLRKQQNLPLSQQENEIPRRCLLISFLGPSLK